MSRDVKVVTEIKKDGDGYIISRIRPKKTISNKIVLGQECELDTIKGDKIKVSFRFTYLNFLIFKLLTLKSRVIYCNSFF